MVDHVDKAQELVEQLGEAELERIRKEASEIPAGSPGTCELCGSWSGRLVNGACAPCRDKYELP